MNGFIGNVWTALRNAGYTDATITPKAIFDGLRAETKRLELEGIGYGLHSVIYKRAPEKLAQVETLIGSRMPQLTLSEACVKSVSDALVGWYYPHVEDAEWLAGELGEELRSQGVQGVPDRDALTRAAIAVRDSFPMRDAEYALFAKHQGDTMAALCAQSYDAIPEAVRATEGVTAAFAVNIESLLRFGVGISDAPKSPSRMEWVQSAIAAANVSPRKTPTHSSLAVAAAAALTPGTVGGFLQPGIHHQPSMSRAPLADASPGQRAAFFARLRDVNNVMFTQVCFDLGNRLAAADTSSAIAAPTVTPYHALTQLAFVVNGANTDTTSVFEKTRAAAPEKFAQVADCIVPAKLAANGGLTGRSDFYVRLPVGELGLPLARALSDAVSIGTAAAEALAKEIAEDSAAPATERILFATTLLQKHQAILTEGIVSIAQTIALLLAKKPPAPYDTPDAALKLIDDAKLVTQVAGMAPFGVVAPMANIGVVPGEPVNIVATTRGARAQLPEGFEAVLHAVRAARVEYLHGGDLRPWLDSDHRNETGRGCPVAGRGPVLGPDGKVTMSKDAGLTELTHQFIELTRKLLAAQAS